MTKRFYIFCCLVTAWCCAAGQEHPITTVNARKRPSMFLVRNPSAFERKNEIITVPRKSLGTIKHGLVARARMNGRLLITQTIDHNGDGVWDALLIEVSLRAAARGILRVDWVSPAAAPVFQVTTGVRLSLKTTTTEPMPDIPHTVRLRGFKQDIANPYYQLEGPGIENDKVAFRTFFDSRNGKDIFGKIKTQPVLDQIGVNGSWHTMQDWGMDIFKTGASLGAGGLGVLENNVVHRLGDADTTQFKKLYAGTLSASFSLNFTGWDTGLHKGSGSEQLSINKGDYFYHNVIRTLLSNGQLLLCGIARFTGDPVRFKRENDQFASLSIYGLQAEGSATRLGVAILFPLVDYVKTDTTLTENPVSHTAYVALKPRAVQHIYFIAGWEKTDPQFSTQQGFNHYLQQTAARLSQPIQIIRIKNS